MTFCGDWLCLVLAAFPLFSVVSCLRQYVGYYELKERSTLHTMGSRKIYHSIPSSPLPHVLGLLCPFRICSGERNVQLLPRLLDEAASHLMIEGGKEKEGGGYFRLFLHESINGCSSTVATSICICIRRPLYCLIPHLPEYERNVSGLGGLTKP